MLQIIIDWFLYSLLGLEFGSTLAQSLNFFIYDSIQIIFLLFAMIFAIGFLRTYIPQSKMQKFFSKGGALSNLAASLFGAITPFCSCSSIPIFLSLIKARAPLGAAFSFLITSPLVNEYLVVLMLGFFGWKITAAYVLSGILIGTFAGLILGRLGLEKYLVKDMFETNSKQQKEAKYSSVSQRLSFGFEEASSITSKIWGWVLAGVAIGAIIHNYVPQELIEGAIESSGVLAVPLATLLGVPIYGSCAAVVPIAVALFAKGVPLGTALAFMMATAALSLPEAVMLRRAMRIELIAIFFGITALAIIFTGYLLNFLQEFLV